MGTAATRRLIAQYTDLYQQFFPRCNKCLNCGGNVMGKHWDNNRIIVGLLPRSACHFAW